MPKFVSILMLVLLCLFTVSARGLVAEGYASNGTASDAIGNLDSLRKAAEQGNANAQYELGMYYDEGPLKDRDFQEALKWLKKAAAQGNAKHQNALGVYYYSHVPHKYEEALSWFRKAAAQGNADAMSNIANCYRFGDGVEKSTNEAIGWWKKAAAVRESKPQKTTATTGNINGHDWIDLGLSVKWATYNVGAPSATYYRFSYFAWGEIIGGKYEYNEHTSNFYTVKITNSIERVANYDAARANWGGSWRLPTKKEMDELISKCKWQWVRQYFIGGYFLEGYNVTGPNGNSIFLPANGKAEGRSAGPVETMGYYSTATPHQDSKLAYALSFTNGKYECKGVLRSMGLSVRAVSD